MLTQLSWLHLISHQKTNHLNLHPGLFLSQTVIIIGCDKCLPACVWLLLVSMISYGVYSGSVDTQYVN